MAKDIIGSMKARTDCRGNQIASLTELKEQHSSDDNIPPIEVSATTNAQGQSEVSKN